MKYNSFKKSFLALILTLCVIFAMAPMAVLAAEVESSEPVVVIAGSDFQHEDGDAQGAAYLTELLNSVKKEYPTVDGMLFAGDYDYDISDEASSKAATTALTDAVSGVYSNLSYPENVVLVQGNHDPDSLVGNTISASGANDKDAYGVYVINEKDYMWYGNDEATVKNTAEALDVYLKAKINEKYTKPIFVVSHLPLHYSYRTFRDGDGKYANYIFDVLNAAGAEGLNIFFLFGHNHSNGWDDYLGGSAVYLAKGDSINIAQAHYKNFNAETLNFTYLNAGYVSYYRDVNDGAEADLTMTVFSITEDDVTIERYTTEGLHDLKSVGVRNTHKGERGYQVTTNTYTSPQVVSLDKSLLEDKSPTVTSEHLTIKLDNLKGAKDFLIAKGTYSNYKELKPYKIYRATYLKFEDTGKFEYTASQPGDYTVIVRYADGSEDLVLHCTLEATLPEIAVDGLNVTVSNLDDIYVIRCAPGVYATSGQVKRAKGCRNFTSRTINGADSYTFTCTQVGTYTIVVQYNSGLIVVETVTIEATLPEIAVDGLNVTVSNLDDIYVIRCAPGVYTTSGQVKRAEGCRNFTSRTINGVDSYTFTCTEEGTYTVVVQYNSGLTVVETITIS